MCGRTLFLTVLGLLCLTTTGTKASSYLWLDPPRIVKSYGSPVSVDCNVNDTNIEVLTLDWEAPEGVVKETGPLKRTWTVERLTEMDMDPLCFINYKTNTSMDIQQGKVPLHVTIYKLPDRVSIIAVGHTGPMVEGSQYELQCEIQNVAPVRFLTVKWYKGETLVGNKTFNEPTKTPMNLLTKLQISPKRDDIGAQYRCVAQLDLGPDGPQPPPTVESEALNITVHYGPEINCSSKVIVKQGEHFFPNCTVVGYPTPEITWSKDGIEVDLRQRMDRADAGQYFLTASSNDRVANHTLEIEVLYAPFEIQELNGKTIDYGYNEVLKCTSLANPRPQYRWETPAKDLSNIRIRNEDGVSLLFIGYATGQNTGTYTCVAYNIHGNISQSVRVDVRASTDKVSISTLGHSGPMIEDRQYYLLCEVQYAAPVNHVTINWYKGQTQLYSQSFTQSSHAEKNQTSDTLPVSPNRTENGTQFWCEAVLKPTATESHTITIHSSRHTVIVHYKPVINTSKLPPVVPMFRGYPEVLVCEAEGYPQPTISWTHKHSTTEGGNLTIPEATNESVGVYNCTANNSVGSTVRMVKVIWKEDYLPLIAGFVALVVVIISVFFIIIYSIYYKNTKMGTYIVEGAKPNAQNGNVAQNGKDNAIPMKKLSQDTICMQDVPV